MRVAHIKTTIDRYTGEVKNQEIVGYEEVNEDKYYRPLVEVLWARIKEEFYEGAGKPNGHTSKVAGLV